MDSYHTSFRHKYLWFFVFILVVFSCTAWADSNDQINETDIWILDPPNKVYYEGTIDVGTDVDMFRIDVSAGQRIAFDIDERGNSNIDSYIRLFNQSGLQLDYNDDDPGPGEPTDTIESYLEYTFSSSGSYYIGVSGYGNDSYNSITGGDDVSAAGDIGMYTIWATDLTPEPSKPDLLPWQPSNWSDKIIISHVENSNSDGTIYANQTSYISYAFANISETDVDDDFYVEIWDDTTNEQMIRQQETSALNQTGMIRRNEQWTFTQNGWHTIRIIVDAEDNIDEGSDEGNNEYTRTVYVNPAPQITVTLPNGGESWQAGANEDITWNSTAGVGANVTIELYKDDVPHSTIVASTPNDGTYTWPIPLNLQAGTTYQVKIIDTATSSTYDYSNGYFYVTIPLPVDNVEIISFSPPTGVLERGTGNQATVSVKNTGSTTRSFWVGLSFAHESTTNSNWPEGWYDIQPIQTNSLQPDEEQLITFEWTIPSTLRSGQYYAAAAVWDRFDEDLYIMKDRMDDTRGLNPSDSQTGEPSFYLEMFELSPDTTTVMEQIEEVLTVILGEGFEYSYNNLGDKPLLYLGATAPFAIGGVPIYAGGSILLDIMDLVAFTPEGEDGYVTIWIAADYGLGYTASATGTPINLGVIPQVFDPYEKGLADYRKDYLEFLQLALPGKFVFTSAHYDQEDGWIGPRLEWNGTTGFSASLIATENNLVLVEVKREILLNILNEQAALLSYDLESYVQSCFELLEGLSSDSFRIGSFDDGDWELTPGVWEPNLKMTRFGSDPLDYANYFYVEVPENTSELKVITTGGTGNLSLFSRYGQRPDGVGHEGEEYLGFSVNSGNEESITISDPPAGKFYLMLVALDVYEGVDLVATVTTAPPVLSVAPDNREVSYGNATTSFSVSNSGGSTMPWIAEVIDGDSWLSITDGLSGTDNGTITASYMDNNSMLQRIGTIRITASEVNGSPKDVTVTQARMYVPNADAGPDQSVTDIDSSGSELVTLDGSGSVDPDGTIVSYVWTDSLGDTIPDGVNSTAILSIGLHEVTLTVTDNDDLTDTDTVSIMVDSGSNTPPVLDVIGDKSVAEEDTLSFTISAIDSDENSITYGATGTAIDAGATLVGQNFSWTPSNIQAGIYQATFTATSLGGSDSETITITVHKRPTANAGPDQTVIDNTGPSGSEPVTLDGSGSTDLDGTIVNYAWTDNLGDTIPYGVNPTVALSVGIHTITLTVTNNDGLTDTDTVTITVNSSTNEAPVLAAIDDKSGDEGLLIGFVAIATDDDADTLTFSLSGEPAGASIDAVTGSFRWTPTEAQGPGVYTVRVVVTDSGAGNLTDFEDVTVTVGEVNASPVLNTPNPNPNPVGEGNLVIFTATATDSDIPANTLTFSLVGFPAGASIDAGGDFTWTPSEGQGPGIYNVTVRVEDGSGGSDEETVSITVNEINTAPVLDTIDDDSVDVGSQLTFTANATDTDVLANTLTYSLTTAPAGASINSSTGAFTWTAPNGSYGQTENVTVRVTDDGSPNLFDDETMQITVTQDTTDPIVSEQSQADSDIEVMANSLVDMSIADLGTGVNPATVTIDVTIDAVTTRVYSGDVDEDNSSSLGTCRRTGSNADYKYTFQPTNKFDFDEDVTVTINASDLAIVPNAMAEYSYTFTTAMRSFGEKKTLRTLTDDRQIISSGANQDSERSLTTVTDSSGNVWAAWTEGDKDGNNNLINRDVYLGKITPGADSFENGGVLQITNDAPGQANPVLAIDSSNNLYLVWQDLRLGNWDLYVMTSSDGWANETRITDPNFNQTNPAMAVNSNGVVYIVYDDDQSGDKDIYIASSADNYVSKTQITDPLNAEYDQTTPDIAIDDSDTVYVVWSDARNWHGNGPRQRTDIYGAASNNAWTNIEIIDKDEDGQQTMPQIATEDSGTILHFVWEDDGPGDKDIYYASSDGLPGTPLIGINIIDQGLPPDIEQRKPAIAITGSGANAKVFACWEDERYGYIENIYAVEITNLGTNIWVGDDGAGADQKVPAIGIDQYKEPFLVWVNNKADIIYSGSTIDDPVPVVASTLVDASANTTVGNTGSFSATFPAGAYICDMDVSISLTRNPPKNPLAKHSMLYEFGPSDITFNTPVTVTIPFSESALGNRPRPYWFIVDPLLVLANDGSPISTDGISKVTYGPGVVSFKTTHFSGFGLGGGYGADAGDDVELSADQDCMASYTLDGSGSTCNDCDQLEYLWYYDDELFAEGVEVEVQLGLGENKFVLIVTDGEEDSDPNEVVITVVDDTPPEFSVWMNHRILWPANNKMINVEPVFEVRDNCGGEISIELDEITCNQQSNNDIEVTDDRIYLRAKRLGTDKAGRVYTLNYIATDEAGNISLSSATVVVPHDLIDGRSKGRRGTLRRLRQRRR